MGRSLDFTSLTAVGTVGWYVAGGLALLAPIAVVLLYRERRVCRERLDLLANVIDTIDQVSPDQPAAWPRQTQYRRLVDAIEAMLQRLQRSETALARRNRQLHALQQIAARLKSATEVEEVLDFVTCGIRDALGFSSLFLYLLDKESHKLVLTRWIGSAPPVETELSVLDDTEHPLVQALRRTQPTSVEICDPGDVLAPLGSTCTTVPLIGRKEWQCWEYHDCEHHRCGAFENLSVHCWMLDGKPCDKTSHSNRASVLQECLQCEIFSMVGVLVVSDPAEETDPEVLMALADQAGLAIETAQLYERLRRFNQNLEAQVAVATQHLLETREQLVQSEKLAAIGRLAAGIAHEMNNPLAAISNYAQSLLMEAHDPAARDELKAIRRQVHRASRITQDLLEFARPKPLLTEPFDLHELLRSVLELASYHTECKYLSVDLQLNADKPCMLGNAHQIEEVFLNLILNAGQAMRGEGKLLIGTRILDIDPPHIEIRFSDSGPGISSNARERIFEPFFTMKEVGEGTGLGLYISYWIVERHGGKLAVAEGSGPGATFTVTLPLEVS